MAISKAAPTKTVAAKKTVVSRQLINVLHHNKAMYHRDWFGQGQCILFVEKVRYSDGSVVKQVVKNSDPTIRYYMTKPEFQAEHTYPKLAFPLEKCEMYESKVDKLFKDIALLTNQMAFFEETRGPGSNRRRKQLHANRFLHGSDANIVDNYIDRYMEHHKDVLDTTSPLDLAYADIEVDIIDHVGFPEECIAPCPVSLITYFHAPSKHLTQYILRNTVRANPLIAVVEADEGQTLNAFMLANVNRGLLEKPRKDPAGGKEKLPALIKEGEDWRVIAAMLGLIEVEGVERSEEAIALMRCVSYEPIFLDTEEDVIINFIDRVNEVDRPDILSFWNAKFDIKTLINRLRRLGFDPEEVFSADDFGKWKLADYAEDTFNTEPTDNNDIFNVMSYTIYVDQMTAYASLRKTSGKKESYGLNFTLEAEIGEGKLQYEGELRDLPYTDFESFLLYGAIDVVPMHTLEVTTDDLATLYQLSMITRTRFHKVLKKTTCLRNLANVFYRDKGLALSNNRNRLKERTTREKFRGAFVADPMLMDHTGILIGGQASNRVFDDSVDFDAAALYPNIIKSGHVDAETRIGRILVQQMDGTYGSSAEEMEAVAAGDQIALGQAWLGLPGLYELHRVAQAVSAE